MKISKKTFEKEPPWLITILIGIFLGLIVGWILAPLGNPVTDFSEKYVFGKTSDLRVILSSVYFLERKSTDIIDLPKTLGFEVTTDKEGNKQLLGLNTTLGSASSIILDNNSLIVFPNLFTILSKATDSNGTEYCLIHTITTNGKVVANESYAFKYYFDWDEWQKPSCKDCLQHTIAVYNAGNKEIKDQRVNICATNKIYNITGNDEFWISPDRCFEIRRETLLEKDEIAGRFIQEIPKKYTFNNRSIIFENRKYDVIAWNDGQSEAIEGLHVNTWNRNQQETDQLKIWNVAVIIIPNCHIGY